MLARMAKYENWTKEALISRVLELEKLKQDHSPVSNAARIGEPKLTPARQDSSAVPAAGPGSGTSPANRKKAKQMDFSKYSTRHVAIKFAYLGWSYYGLAVQKDPNTPTVEEQILKALAKTRCIPSPDPLECNFSRCGRTDRDVSAMAQVISLDLRSLLTKEEHADPALDDRELDYLKILNSHLPDDILAYQICLRPPPDFDARFSCTYRHYRYYFSGRGLDIGLMSEAAKYLLGEHDFQNFCRVDASKQITNFKRTILEAEVIPQEDYYYLSLRGTAFLWNQVRSIMAILFMVGQTYEPPSVVQRLLDIKATPRRPVYEISWGVPLVLYDCGFEGVEWKQSQYTNPDKVFNVAHEHWTKMTLAETMLDVVRPFSQPLSTDRGNTGEGIGKRSRRIPLFDRQFLDPPEVINARWRAKNESK